MVIHVCARACVTLVMTVVRKILPAALACLFVSTHVIWFAFLVRIWPPGVEAVAMVVPVYVVLTYTNKYIHTYIHTYLTMHICITMHAYNPRIYGRTWANRTIVCWINFLRTCSPDSYPKLLIQLHPQNLQRASVLLALPRMIIGDAARLLAIARVNRQLTHTAHLPIGVAKLQGICTLLTKNTGMKVFQWDVAEKVMLCYNQSYSICSVSIFVCV